MTSYNDAGDMVFNLKTKCIQLYLPLPPTSMKRRQALFLDNCPSSWNQKLLKFCLSFGIFYQVLSLPHPPLLGNSSLSVQQSWFLIHTASGEEGTFNFGNHYTGGIGNFLKPVHYIILVHVVYFFFCFFSPHSAIDNGNSYLNDSGNQKWCFGFSLSSKQPDQDKFVERRHGRSLFCLSSCCGKWMALLVLGLYSFLKFFFF